MGNYTVSKQENDFSIFKNKVCGTVSPPDCTPSACEGQMSRGKHCCHTRVRNEKVPLVGMVLMGPEVPQGDCG